MWGRIRKWQPVGNEFSANSSIAACFDNHAADSRRHIEAGYGTGPQLLPDFSKHISRNALASGSRVVRYSEPDASMYRLIFRADTQQHREVITASFLRDESLPLDPATNEIGDDGLNRRERREQRSGENVAVRNSLFQVLCSLRPLLFNLPCSIAGCRLDTSRHRPALDDVSGTWVEALSVLNVSLAECR